LGLHCGRAPAGERSPRASAVTKRRASEPAKAGLGRRGVAGGEGKWSGAPEEPEPEPETSDSRVSRPNDTCQNRCKSCSSVSLNAANERTLVDAGWQPMRRGAVRGNVE
jgi:hypothetical protein